MAGIRIDDDVPTLSGKAPYPAPLAVLQGLPEESEAPVMMTDTRPSDIMISRANPARALDRLGWQATTRMEEVVQRMSLAERVPLSIAENPQEQRPIS